MKKLLTALAICGFTEMNLVADSTNSRTLTVGNTTVTVYRDSTPSTELDKPTIDNNVFAVRQDGKIILVNAGLGGDGGFLKHFIADDNNPEDVAAILLTNLNADYIGGLVSFRKFGARNGGFLYLNMKATFPNAKVYISKSQVEHWNSENIDNAAVSRARNFYADRVITFDFDTEILPGITAVKAPEQPSSSTIFVTRDIMFIGGLDVDTTVADQQGKVWQQHATDQKLHIAGSRLSFPAVGKLTPNNKDGYTFTVAE